MKNLHLKLCNFLYTVSKVNLPLDLYSAPEIVWSTVFYSKERPSHTFLLYSFLLIIRVLLHCAHTKCAASLPWNVSRDSRRVQTVTYFNHGNQ